AGVEISSRATIAPEEIAPFHFTTHATVPAWVPQTTPTPLKSLFLAVFRRKAMLPRGSLDKGWLT
ncbi:MAG: hypothetical protein N2C14_13880, partial [Planctomycetales bacterium]